MRAQIRFLSVMKTFRKSLPLWLAIALGCGGSAGMAAVNPPKVISAERPEHPPALFERGFGGFATVVIHIAADGSVSEAEVGEASDPALGEAAIAAVKQWKFEPATRDGKPVAIKVSQRFEFPASVERALTFLAGREVFVPEPEEVFEMSDLAREPVMTVPPARPNYPERFAGSGETADVPLQFLITPEGLPVNLQVVANEDQRGPNLAFQLSALRAFLLARWEPPIRDGHAVYVRASKTIHVEPLPDPDSSEKPHSGSAEPLLPEGPGE